MVVVVVGLWVALCGPPWRFHWGLGSASPIRQPRAQQGCLLSYNGLVRAPHTRAERPSQVDALLSDWEDAADRAAAAESELRAAERLRGALVRAEDEAREQAGLSPRRGGVGGDEGEDEEAADGVQARDPLPLKARSSVRLARGRVEGAEAREGAARAAAVAAAAELRAAEAAADERVREVGRKRVALRLTGHANVAAAASAYARMGFYLEGRCVVGARHRPLPNAL
jgi:hypothetical protein